jgi:glycine/serine hydroxymethyltransferase
MRLIGGWIVEILRDVGNTSLQQRVRRNVTDLTREFPVP